jgi:hypothetical protein
MNPFKSSPTQRLATWAAFRDSLPNLTEAEQIQQVAEFWAQCPFDRWLLEPSAPETWPSVWEMLYEGTYCMNAVAVGIETTLRLAGWDANRLELVMMKEVDNISAEYFVVKIDGTHILNYSYGKCVPVAETQGKVEFQYAYRWAGRTYAQAK